MRTQIDSLMEANRLMKKDVVELRTENDKYISKMNQVHI